MLESLRRWLRPRADRETAHPPTQKHKKRPSWPSRQFRESKKFAKLSLSRSTSTKYHDHNAEESTFGECENDRSTQPQLLELPVSLRWNPFSRATFSACATGTPQEVYQFRPEQPFRFCDLPPELRALVLTHYFGRHIFSTKFNSSIPGQRIHRSFCTHPLRYDINATAILQTCKQLRKEGEDALYNCTTFIIKVVPISYQIGDLKAELDLGGGLQLAKIRRAVLNIIIEEPERDGVTGEILWLHDPKTPAVDLLVRTVARGEGLKTAEVHIDLGSLSRENAENVFQKLMKLKVDRLKRISCVRTEDMSDDGNAICVPFKDSEGYRQLVEKFKAVDVSKQQCGSVLPRLMDGDFDELDTSIINNWN